MNKRARLVAGLGAFVVLAALASGCGGGSNNSTGTGGSTGGEAGAGGTAGSGGTSSGGMAGAGGATGGGGSTTGGTAGSGGGTTSSGPSDLGAPATAFVSAGGTSKSANYKMVFTLGQSSINQTRTKSANYTLQGGLIGATGAAK